MPVDSVHPDFEKVADRRARLRATATGSDAVKSAGEAFLPSLSGMTAKEYDAYKQRAYFYGAVERTLQGITGLVFRKSPIYTLPMPRLIEGSRLIEDVTLTGVPLDRFCQSVYREVLAMGFAGVYVSLPEMASVQARAYLTLFQAEDVINWGLFWNGNSFQLGRVVLRESTYRESEDDPYKLESATLYRDMHLDESGLFRVTVWEEADKPTASEDQWIVSEVIEPRFRGQRLPFIPFVPISSQTTEFKLDQMPLLPLADTNLDHYRLMADYRHGLHYVGLPTPYVTGFPEQTELKIGSATAWVASDPAAKVGMLEFTGQGLDPLAAAIDTTVGYMASLGARLLEPNKKAVESAETHSIRQAREESTAATIAESVSAGMSHALTWMLNLSGIPGASQIDLNTDLVDAKLSPEELRELVSGWQAGAYSYDTLYYNLQRGELARPQISAEEERDMVGMQSPSILSLEGVE